MSIGYACLTLGVQNTAISRCILKNATEENLRNRIITNLTSLNAIIDYNAANGIKLFRISSDIIPFGSHPVNQIKWWEDYQDILLQIGSKIKDNSIRVSMHPGQYTVLNASNPAVVKNATDDILYHARFLDALRTDITSKIILHIGGVYGDKDQASREFIKNFNVLPETIRNRIIIENDDKNYTIADVLSISKEIGAPVVFDNLHHTINPPMEYRTEAEWLTLCKTTWKKTDGRQKIHYSQQKENAVKGSHSDTIFLKPFLDFYQSLPDPEIDIMLEVKDKNLSAVKCKNVIADVKTKKLEEEWARYKYFVLSRSANLYGEVRELMQQKESRKSFEFYDIIEQALLLDENVGAEINAAQHIWGYFNKDCSLVEKMRFDKLLTSYQKGESSLNSVKNHLFRSAMKRGNEYLLNSLYFVL